MKIIFHHRIDDDIDRSVSARRDNLSVLRFIQPGEKTFDGNAAVRPQRHHDHASGLKFCHDLIQIALKHTAPRLRIIDQKDFILSR